MRVRDFIGFPFLGVGLSGVTLGHHWLGQIVFWGGTCIAAVGLAIISSGGLQDKIEKALRSYSGPGDGGSTDYHGGRSTTERDFGGSHGDGDAD
jgi:hypothetical protein